MDKENRPAGSVCLRRCFSQDVKIHTIPVQRRSEELVDVIQLHKIIVYLLTVPFPDQRGDFPSDFYHFLIQIQIFILTH